MCWVSHLLLVAGAFAAVQADTPLAQRDLEGKKAYYAARAGVNKFLYELNQNPNYWQTCPAVTKTAISLNARASILAYKPVPANGATACDPSPPSTGDPISTMIDADAGTFRCSSSATLALRGPARLIASFRKDTPLDSLFTVSRRSDRPPTTIRVWRWTHAGAETRAQRALFN